MPMQSALDVLERWHNVGCAVLMYRYIQGKCSTETKEIFQDCMDFTAFWSYLHSAQDTTATRSASIALPVFRTPYRLWSFL